MATGTDAAQVAQALVDGLAAPGLRLAFVFADWRLDPATIAGVTQRALRAPIVGGTTTGVVGRDVTGQAVTACGFGLYGDWLRVGIGVAKDLPTASLSRSRDAVAEAAKALGTPVNALDPTRHVGITVVDGTCGYEESFCIGSAAAAPQIRVVGGSTSAEVSPARRSHTWVNGEVMIDAGAVVLIDSALPFHAVSSAHMIPTDLKTVVTAASGRLIYELDGRPAVARVRELVSKLGDTLDEPRPAHTFARYVDGKSYLRSMIFLDGDSIRLAGAVEPGHVLRIMRPGDLIGTTRRDLALVAERVGGKIAALLAFSCAGRHAEAAARGLEAELADVYALYPTVGFHTFGEQYGMLLVNHTLTGLAIGASR